ncbi:hypothetical protein MNBD_GAMMA01-1664 [hydrothermal vent metagenome]|uniref:Antitoxin Xre/MbcA/ParS-like toxin-binding domain-containing protein n=1 Tax=hydrothermal vent metagenome TaxID=652676 RepID=A0A3B0V4K3_9ZZZZ
MNIQAAQFDMLKTIPIGINDSEMLNRIHSEDINSDYLQLLKETAPFNDESLSYWLNINVKTFRSYKQEKQKLNINIREHVLLLLSLMQHGKYVFATAEKFRDWLIKDNYFLDGKAPVDFLQTITGIRFIDRQLTAMEYGDNV